MDERAAGRALSALELYRDGPPKHPRSYPDLHEHVLALARAGLLVVVDEPINKDTEMHPLVRWQYRGGIADPIAPRLIPHAPCQELVTTGADLERDGGGLDGLPVPISTPGWDNAPYLSAGHYITKDPDTGIQNVGNYRGQLKAPRRLGMNPSVELR